MSVELLNDFGVGNFNLTTITETINRSYKGKNEVTISNYDGTGAPVVKVGSVFDNNGALYIVSGSDETPTGYAGISSMSDFYLIFDVSALAFIYTETAPTWNDAMQGWYNGNDRYLFFMYKDDSGTLYENKSILINQSNEQLNSLTLSKKIVTNNILSKNDQSIHPNTITKIGSSFSFGALFSTKITALTKNSIAFISSNGALKTFIFNGSTWSQTGSTLTITGASIPNITTMSSTQIAYYDRGNDALRVYTFNGSTWSQTGSDFTITSADVFSLTALTSTTIAVSDGSGFTIKAYTFNGSTWSQTGNTLSPGFSTKITALSSTDIAAIRGSGTTSIIIYRFDGTDFKQIGLAETITEIQTGVPSAINSNTIAIVGLTIGGVVVYKFNGYNWEKEVSEIDISGLASPDITLIDNDKIVVADSGTGTLDVYKIGYLETFPPAPVFDDIG